MEIVTAARRDVRQIVMEARRELLVLSAQVQAALGEAGARPDPTTLLNRGRDTGDDLVGDASEFTDAIFAPEEAVKGMLDEARADMDALIEDARTVPFEALGALPPQIATAGNLPHRDTARGAVHRGATLHRCRTADVDVFCCPRSFPVMRSPCPPVGACGPSSCCSVLPAWPSSSERSGGCVSGSASAPETAARSTATSPPAVTAPGHDAVRDLAHSIIGIAHSTCARAKGPGLGESVARRRGPSILVASNDS